MAKWLDKYDTPQAQNGIEGTMGGLTDVGFNYNGAWGGTMQMGGSLPGAVGFTYARTQSPAPANGPYAKKTKASAQNGQEMKYYQEGLDFKPKTISQDGSEISMAQKGKKIIIGGKREFDKYNNESPLILDKDGIYRNDMGIAFKFEEPPRKPIVVTDPKDPRLKAYNDSLRLYKAYKMQEKLMGPGRKPSDYKFKWTTDELKKGREKKIVKGLEDVGPISEDFQSKQDQFKEGFNFLTARREDKKLIDYYESLGFKPSEIMYHSSPDVVSDKIRAIGTYFDGTAQSPIYKKPVQPVEYIAPQRDTLYVSDSNDPRLKAYQDSLAVYNSSKFIKEHPLTGNYIPGKEDERQVNINIDKKNVKKYNPKFATTYTGYYWDYKKPVQPVILEEEPRFEKPIPIPRDTRDLGYILPKPGQPTFPELYKYSPDTPTKFSFTSPTGKYNEQKTIYFPSKAALKSFVEGVRGATYQEGADYASATGTLQDGGDIPVDPMGYWNPENVGNPVIIPSNVITMEGVDQPLLGISDTGDVQYMEPGEDYEFDGEYVTEYPMAKGGVSVNNADAQPIKKLDQLLNFTNYNKPTKGGWLDKYN